MAPRFVSPMIRHRSPQNSRPSTTSGLDNVVTTSPSTNLDNGQKPPEPELSEPQPEESALIASGTYRQIRDYSLVLLSQGIVHRLERTEEGPFEIFVDPEHEEKAQYQIKLYCKENPPKKDNPPMPLAISLQPIWVLLVPIACTMADFGNLVGKLHSLGVSDADRILRGEWWRTRALWCHRQ